MRKFGIVALTVALAATFAGAMHAQDATGPRGAVDQLFLGMRRVDDTMASVWAPCTFYLNQRISHCGVNSISLLKDAGGWKITQI